MKLLAALLLVQSPYARSACVTPEVGVARLYMGNNCEGSVYEIKINEFSRNTVRELPENFKNIVKSITYNLPAGVAMIVSEYQGLDKDDFKKWKSVDLVGKGTPYTDLSWLEFVEEARSFMIVDYDTTLGFVCLHNAKIQYGARKCIFLNSGTYKEDELINLDGWWMEDKAESISSNVGRAVRVNFFRNEDGSQQAAEVQGWGANKFDDLGSYNNRISSFRWSINRAYTPAPVPPPTPAPIVGATSMPTVDPNFRATGYWSRADTGDVVNNNEATVSYSKGISRSSSITNTEEVSATFEKAVEVGAYLELSLKWGWAITANGAPLGVGGTTEFSAEYGLAVGTYVLLFDEMAHFGFFRTLMCVILFLFFRRFYGFHSNYLENRNVQPIC